MTAETQEYLSDEQREVVMEAFYRTNGQPVTKREKISALEQDLGGASAFHCNPPPKDEEEYDRLELNALEDTYLIINGFRIR